MLTQVQQNDTEKHRSESAEPNPEGLMALAAGLPPELDAYLKTVVDKAVKRCNKGGMDVRHLLAVFTAGKQQDAEFENLLNVLQTTWTGPTSESHLSAWLLGVASLKPEQRRQAADALTKVLKTTPNRLLSQSRQRLGQAMMKAVGLGLPMAILAASKFWAPSEDFAAFAGLLSGLTGVFFGLLFPPAWLLEHEKERRAACRLRFLAAHALGRIGQPEVIGALAGAVLERTNPLRHIARISLRVLMPRLTVDHYGQLDSEAVPNLCRLLKSGESLGISFGHIDCSFRAELLTALEKVGDARAIPTVRQAVRQWRWDTRENLVLAERVLGVLEERQRQETERGVLLRGAEQPVSDPAELLRAAAQTESKPEQLLRPVD